MAFLGISRCFSVGYDKQAAYFVSLFFMLFILYVGSLLLSLRIFRVLSGNELLLVVISWRYLFSFIHSFCHFANN